MPNSSLMIYNYSMDIDYRMVRVKDADSLLDLLKTVSAEVDSLPQSPVEIAGIDRDEVEAVLASTLRTATFAAAFSEGRMIGMCSIVPVSKEIRRKHIGLMFIAVRSDARGRGVSTHLAEYAIDMAHENGIKKVMMSVIDTSESGKEFLRSLGFISEGKNYRSLNIDGEYLDGERFALLLD